MPLFKIVSRIFLINVFLISSVHAASAIKIDNAWSPEAPPVAKVMAGYMTIHNLGAKDTQIKSAKSTLFKRVEIHLTEMDNGMMRMIKEDNLTIPAKSAVELKPGGLHMMLIGKLKDVKAGSAIPVTVTFANGEHVEIKLMVKLDDIPQMLHEHHHH
jgi:hypothetical protein